MRWGPGKLLHIHIADAASVDMRELPYAELVKDKGIKGDRYFKGNGKYSDIPDVRDVTLIEKEVLDALEENQPPLQDKSIILKPHEHRRNLTTEGVPLKYLVGKQFKIGDAVLEGGRLNFPCKYLEELLNRRLVLPLYNRSGLNCRVVKSGIIKQHDIIEPL